MRYAALKALRCGLAAVLMSALTARATVTYEDFGAKGDGKHDDRAAIVAAHKAANAKGEGVRAKDGATYYVGSGQETAQIMTEVDFGTAKIVIDDREVPPEKRSSPLFRIVSAQPAIALKGVKPLKRGQANLGVKLPCRSVVRLENNRVRRYIRKGLNRNSGSPQQESLLVAADGSIDPTTPLLWDYETVTKATAYPIDAKRLVITGGVFVTRANQAPSRYTYYNRGIRIERSNVEIVGLRHEVTDELDHGAPYTAFVGVIGCADVTVRDCVFTAHKTYKTEGHGGTVSMGSYDLNCWHSVNASFVNCRQTTDIRNRAYWGIFGSNFSRNLLFDGCAFSRFDAHMGVANATVKNCKIGYMGLASIGFGTFLVENTTIYANGFVRLRGDYGCTWDGDFIIRNCIYVPDGGKAIAPVFTGRNNGTHDFGYVCHLPRKVTVDGLLIDDSKHPKDYAGPCLFGNITGDAKAKYAMVVTEEISLNNVSTKSGKALRPFERPEAFSRTRVTLGFALHPSEASNIRCILALPARDAWDGRFWGFGNGGWAGKVSAANAGNSAALTCDLGTSAYKREDNPVPVEILKDFGWRATHLATLEAKRIIREYYGRAPDKSYFTGASTGGGQGLCEAQRYPEDYDGIIAEVPGADRLSRATPSWQFARLCKKHDCKWFSKAEKDAIYAAERIYFAKYEPGWIRGEFILNPIPTPDTLNGCWREIVTRNPGLAHREALWRELFEPVVVRGRRLEPGQVLGMEFDTSWTFLLEKYIGPRKPSEVTEDELLEFADQFNHQFVNPDLSAFRKRGGKLIMYAALEDVSVPPRPVCEYYDAVVAKFGGLEPTREFFVHYLVPGRAHSPAKSKVGGCDQLRAKLMAWVEKGERPGPLDFKLNQQPDCKLRIGYYPENSVTPVGKWKPTSTAAPWGAVIAGWNWTAAMRFMLRESGVKLTVEGGETSFRVGREVAEMKATFALDDEGRIVQEGTVPLEDSQLSLKRLADGSGVHMVVKGSERAWKLSAFDPRREIAVFENRNGVWRKFAYVSAEANSAAGTLTVTVNREGNKSTETIPSPRL